MHPQSQNNSNWESREEKSGLMYYPLQEVVKGMIYSKVCSVLVYNVGR